MKVTKSVVAGGAGFLGSWLCEALLNRGHEVLCLDNLFTGQKANIAKYLPLEKFSFQQWDVTQPLKFEADYVWNLACPASPVDYRYDGIETTKTCFLGTMNLAEQALRCGAVMFQASTSEVYGDPLSSPQLESDFGNVNPIGPRSCYDEGKRVAESLLFDYERQHGLKIRVARIFNTYGPRTAISDGRVISNFVAAAIQDKPLTVYGTGKQTRSFCYVTDLIRGIVTLGLHTENAGIVNLGNPSEYTVADIAKEIIGWADSKSEIVFATKWADDPEMRRPDIAKAKEVLNWQPEVSVEAGVKNTIAYFKTVLSV